MYTKPAKTIVATPATASLELHNSLVATMVAHYTPKLTPELLIAHRKGCYATIINTTINGVKLENTLGTENAKSATEEVLNALSANLSTIQ